MDSLPRTFWDDTKNITEFMDYVAEMLQVKKLEDWYLFIYLGVWSYQAQVPSEYRRDI